MPAMSAEDYRRRFLNRPQKRQEEQIARDDVNRAAAHNYSLEQARLLADFNRKRSEEMNRQNNLLWQIYFGTSIGERIKGLAGALTQGKVVENIEVEDKSTQYPEKLDVVTKKIYRLPYKTFWGREIVRDESLRSFRPVDRNSSGGTTYGQMLSDKKELSNALIIRLEASTPRLNSAQNPIHLVLANNYWREEKMYWTSSWTKKGMAERNEFSRDFDMDLTETGIKSAYSDTEKTLDSAFDALFDSYLEVSGRG